MRIFIVTNILHKEKYRCVAYKSHVPFFISFAPASRGDIRHLYSGRTAFFMPVRPASRGDIRQTWSEPRLDFVSAETKSRPAFFVRVGPASRGDFRSSGGPRGHQNGRAGGFFLSLWKATRPIRIFQKKKFSGQKNF